MSDEMAAKTLICHQSHCHEPTEAPGGIAGTGVTVFSKKSEESNGVLIMIEMFGLLGELGGL